MKPQRIVIALGGNALGSAPHEQLSIVKTTATMIVDLIAQGHQVIIGHGNGPQVGMINLALTLMAQQQPQAPLMPFAECGAMSQGYIGYHLQQAMGDELRRRGLSRPCVTVITQVKVDEADPAFLEPSKPIGAFYSKAEACEFTHSQGWRFMEDAGRGYRRVVASPKPVAIIERATIDTLVKQGTVVITVGGGGVPVVETPQGLQGVDGVIDKDHACATLALEMQADTLLILTAVEQVELNFNTPRSERLAQVTLAQAQRYIEQGHFAKGSMLPKVEACMRFIQSGKPGCQAMIASLEKANAALRGLAGTRIIA